MWTLYSFVTVGFIGAFLKKFYRIFFPLEMKSFDDTYVNDKYTLLCYRILFEDGTSVNKTELSESEVEEIDNSNKIKHILIEYMFNGKFMKYITYEKNITFPFLEN